MKKGKHVIFLGAGASNRSGYPLANELRLLISSRKNWERALVKYEDKHALKGRPITGPGLDYWDRRAKALELFRNGGFGTVDEFCKLATNFDFKEEINGLRGLLRVALGLFNPEENFEESEYYGFVQSLFKNDLVGLREDITILSYNYDPYLEFLLHRALEHRYKVVCNATDEELLDERNKLLGRPFQHLNAVTSGFKKLSNLDWLDEKGPSFAVLKLHGQICYEKDFEVLFVSTPLARASELLTENNHSAPLLFPWEAVNENGFSNEDSFSIGNAPAIFSLLQKIWQRAKREVLAADKISFVGLSVHPFLLDGLKYLFEGKSGTAEIVVANPDNPPWTRENHETHWLNRPHSSAYAVAKMLEKFAPDLQIRGMYKGSPTTDHLTIVSDFASFVRTQLRPVELTRF